MFTFFKCDLALLVALLVESLKETKRIEDHFAILSPRNSSTDVSSFLSIP